MQKNWHRKLFINLLLNATPYKLIRAPGVIYSPDDRSFDQYMQNGFASYLENASNKKQRGVAGCSIAHTRVLESIEERSGVTVVLEDDFTCKEDFFNEALRMVNTFDKDFDVIFFDPWGTGPLGIHKISEGVYNSQRYTYPYYAGSHCLFINNAQIPVILKTIFSKPVSDYDGLLLSSTQLAVYLFYTGKCAVRSIGSDVSPNNRTKYDIRGTLACLLPAKMRDNSSRFKKWFKKRKEKKVFLSAEALQKFEGEYELMEHSNINISITIRNNQLLLIHSWDQSETLFEPVADTNFVAIGKVILLEFIFKGEDIIARMGESSIYRKKRNT